MFLRVLLVAAIGLNFGFVGQAEEYEGLIVKGDYKELTVSCQVAKNQWGITKTDFERATKLRLLGNGIKMLSLPDDSSLWTHWLKIRFDAVGNVYTMSLKLRKMAKVYANTTTFLGPAVDPLQGSYGVFGSTSSKVNIMEALNREIDHFLLDYLETNINHLEALQKFEEFEEWMKKDKKVEDKSSE
jgi:hypothetical protein